MLLASLTPMGWRGWRLATVVVLACAAPMAACSSSDGPPSATSSSTAQPTTDEAVKALIQVPPDRLGLVEDARSSGPLHDTLLIVDASGHPAMAVPEPGWSDVWDSPANKMGMTVAQNLGIYPEDQAAGVVDAMIQRVRDQDPTATLLDAGDLPDGRAYRDRYTVSVIYRVGPIIGYTAVSSLKADASSSAEDRLALAMELAHAQIDKLH